MKRKFKWFVQVLKVKLDFSLKSAMVTALLYGNRAISIGINKDLGVFKPTKDSWMLVGWRIVKNYRLSAMERMNFITVYVAFLKVAYSNAFFRGEKDEGKN